MDFNECRQRLDSLTSILSEAEKPHMEAIRKLRDDYDAQTQLVTAQFLKDSAGLEKGDVINVKFRGKVVPATVFSFSAYFSEKTGREIVVSLMTDKFADIYLILPERDRKEYDTITLDDIIR